MEDKALNKNFWKDVFLPCQKRAEIIKPFVEQVKVFLLQQCGTHKNVLDESIILPLLQSHAKFLDIQLIIFMDRDIKAWRKKFDPDKLKNKKELYKEYFNVANWHEGLFLNYMTLKCPAINFKILTDNHICTLKEAFLRFSQDIKDLCVLFGVHEQKLKIIKIISSNSDLHKKGKQVLILHLFFENIKDKIFKVVYKPSSVFIEKMLFGSQLAKDEGYKSIAQIINEDEQFLKECDCKVPNYKVIHKKDGNSAENYGYLQHLDHEPSFEMDIYDSTNFQIILDFVKKEKKSILEAIEKFSELTIDYKVKKILSDSDSSENDFFAIEEKAVKRYLTQCGMNAAIATVFGLTDLHAENMIVSDCKPYLIDLEFAFQHAFDLKETSLFIDNKLGAFVKGVKTPNDIFFMLHVDDDGVNNFLSTGKNILYFKNLNNRAQEVFVDPNSDSFKKGFNGVLHALFNNKKLIESCLEVIMKSSFIRLTPFSTSEFKGVISNMIKKGDKHFTRFLKGEKKVAEEENNFLKKLVLHDDNIKNLYANFMSLNIPVFYLSLNTKKLYNSDGDCMGEYNGKELLTKDKIMTFIEKQYDFDFVTGGYQKFLESAKAFLLSARTTTPFFQQGGKALLKRVLKEANEEHAIPGNKFDNLFKSGFKSSK